MYTYIYIYIHIKYYISFCKEPFCVVRPFYRCRLFLPDRKAMEGTEWAQLGPLLVGSNMLMPERSWSICRFEKGPWSFQVSKCFLFWRFRFVFVESDRDLKPAIQVGAFRNNRWTEPFLVPLFLSSAWAMHWQVLYCSPQGNHRPKQDSSLAQSAAQAYIKMEKSFDRTAAWRLVKFVIFLDFDKLYSLASSQYLASSRIKNLNLADAPTLESDMLWTSLSQDKQILATAVLCHLLAEATLDAIKEAKGDVRATDCQAFAFTGSVFGTVLVGGFNGKLC